MPISSIPVLRGSHGTVLQFTGDALVWSRNDVEVSIPLQAIAHLRTEGRTVTVELLAQAGTAPAVHRVDGVSQAAAALFVPAVTAALPVRAEEAEEVDGSTLVSTRTVAEPEDEDDPWQRMLRNVALAIGGASIALALAVGLHGEWLKAFMTLLVAALGGGLTAFGAISLSLVYRQWHLPRYGVTVEAEREAAYSYNGTGRYVYTDQHGMRHRISGKATTPTVHVAYDPSKPETAAICRSSLRNVGSALFPLGLLLAGLGVVALLVSVTSEVFQGG
ncbi:DUF3592 domain-containing protein [Streptomyces sp. NPDC056943]|uniref:DUF3592 domain-containing protein n=1 Tax=Streptomyces sp. NPDC056943 TaxID=3345971 RepID=UPI003632DEA0